MSTNAATVALPDLIAVPAGEFRMGDENGRPDERPAHTVWVDAFAVARLPVTNAAYAVFLAASGHMPPRFWDDPRFNNPVQPVVGVSWHDAVAYCAWLSGESGRRCHLPTEAE